MDRCNIPPNQLAFCINEFVEDVNLPDHLKISGSKLRNDAQFTREKKLSNQKGLSITGLGLDGKDDHQNLETRKITNKRRRTVMTTKSNITVVETPSEDYLGHYSIDSKSGICTLNGLIIFLDKRRISYRKSLKTVNSDGTGTQTGWENGTIALLEENLKRPLQWLICFIHHMERPWLRLFLKIDGASLSKDSFKGPIGQLVTGSLEETDVVSFAIIPCHDVSISNTN